MRLELTCLCGARLGLTVEYASQIRVEREAFDVAHEVCRESGRPLVLWGGDQA